MPRVKIDYVVSFSSEDPEHPASNLLSWEVSKKKWLCKKGESSASVVLQLEKAVQIQSMSIGVERSALLEVLVGLSENPNHPFENSVSSGNLCNPTLVLPFFGHRLLKVLVPKCVVVSASEARRGAGEQRVRSFAGEQLSAARARRWDRLRLVCDQPYNRDCQFGLSFVHVFSPEEAGGARGAAPVPGAVGLAGAAGVLGADSSSDDEFRPGELFARYQAARAARAPLTHTPSTEVHIRQASSNVLRKLEEPAVTLRRSPVCKRPDSPARTERKRPASPASTERKRPTSPASTERKRPASPATSKRKRPTSPVTPKRAPADSPGSCKRRRGARSSSPGGERAAGEVLRGVVFALSGYEHPERGRVRDAALRLGARYCPAADARLTHLVCAFPNTPKLRAARALAPDLRAVTARWVLACERAARRLPWRWYATLPHDRRTPPPEEPPPPSRPPSDEDTEDEIERVRAQQAAEEADSDSTVGWDSPPPRRPLRADRVVASALAGVRVAVDGRCARAHLLRRYLRAYGALLHQEGAEGADVVVSEGGAGERPAWLWRLHRRARARTHPSTT